MKQKQSCKTCRFFTDPRCNHYAMVQEVSTRQTTITAPFHPPTPAGLFVCTLHEPRPAPERP